MPRAFSSLNCPKPQQKPTSTSWQVHCCTTGVVNCAECQKEPLTPGHFCPCCGRKLSLQERRALETNAPPTRCQSCGVFSTDGELCKSCQQAFGAVLGTTTVTPPSNDSATAASQKPPVVEMMAELPQVPDVAQVAHVALPPPVAKVDAVKQAAAAEIAKAETARAVADLTAQAHLARAKNSTIAPSIPRRPIVSAPPLPQQRSRTPMLITAVTVIVVVIGAAEGARRFGLHSPQQGASEGQQVEAAAAVNTVTHAARPAKPSDTRSAVKIVAENRAPAIPMAQAALSPKPSPKLLPKPTAKPTPKPTPKAAAVRRPPVRQANSSNQRVVPVVAPAAPPATLAPVPASPTAAVAVNSPRASAPPVGRLFERKDVDQPPQVATRVAPKLPANVPDHMRNGTVVVRVLVSRTGHASSVSLLRGSTLGRSSDEAVIAAVTQWTFSPAKKQGEPVNCWFNIGVPLAQAN